MADQTLKRKHHRTEPNIRVPSSILFHSPAVNSGETALADSDDPAEPIIVEPPSVAVVNAALNSDETALANPDGPIITLALNFAIPGGDFQEGDAETDDTVRTNSITLYLKIPVAVFSPITKKPLRWLSYVGYAISGIVGVLESEEGLPLDLEAAQAPARVQYNMGNASTVPVADPFTGDDRTSAKTDANPRESAFALDVRARDKTCVFFALPVGTGANISINTEAIHLVPHSKGSDYMQNISNQRGPLYPLEHPLRNIDDARNGILGSTPMHRSGLANMHAALLPVPNQFMGLNDVIRNDSFAPPGQMRVHLHVIHHEFYRNFDLNMRIRQHFMWNGMILRTDYESNNCVSHLLLDFVYGATILKRFLEPSSSQAIYEVYARDLYYLEAEYQPSEAGDDLDREDSDDQGGSDDNSTGRKKQCTVNPLDLVYILSDVGHQMREKKLQKARLRNWLGPY